MSEHEHESPNASGEIERENIAAEKRETLPSEQKSPFREPKDEMPGDDMLPAVRYRRKNTNLHMAGIAIAVFVLLVAVLFACMAAGAKNTEAPSETTGESESGVESPSETNGEVKNLYDFDPTGVPEGHIAFRPMDLSGAEGTITNGTQLDPDLASLENRYAEIDGESSVKSFTEPLVLILHTHASEAYSADDAVSWDGTGELARSDDPSQSVIAVGAVLADALNAAGIPTLHCETFHDVNESGVGTYSGSYARAAETTEHYLAIYPTVKYVIDLHRDAVLDADGNIVRAVTEIGGEPVAQIMPVVGSSENGTAFDWESGLALALALTKRLNTEYPALCRAPNLKSSSFNQELAVHSLILEIGTAANSLEEAKRAVSLLAPELAALIRDVEAAEETAN